MTAEELFSVQRDENKLRSLHIELSRHEDFNPYKGNVITDMPKGGEGKDFLEWYVEERDRIKKEIALYEKKLQEDRAKVEAFIDSAPYPECDIIRFRAINNLSWEEIGDLVGYTRRWTAKRFWGYLKEDRKDRKDHSKV